MDKIRKVHELLNTKKDIPVFSPGDTIEVVYLITEGEKERPQAFKGDVIQINSEGATKTFTVRKISNGVGVERIFPLHSPAIREIKVLKKGRVRRSKLYYLRSRLGKKAKIKEKSRK